MRRSLAPVVLAMLIALPIGAPAAAAEPTPASGSAPATDAAGRPDPTGRYIVMLKAGVDSKAVLKKHAARDKVKADRTYTKALRGFSATLTSPQRRALRADSNVLAVVPDEVIEVTQVVPTGVSRIGGRSNTIAAIDGVDSRVDADVAIVDTGIANHPDLNVAGGYNCSTSDRTAWRDVEGHGTHVAGTVAALDNGFGVVGVAPGARLWAVKILNDNGYGLLSWYVCGLDWVLAQRDPSDSARPLFEAANMSVAKDGSDDGKCGATNHDPLHAAICRVVAGGITVVAAAANDSRNASTRVPASYNEVITVSALADTDGKAGGLGGHACFSWGSYDRDDTFANFSNYGSDVDLIAPGKCIVSTRPGSTYGTLSGTSMAAPAVTGAVALYKASRPRATPAEVKEALQYLGNLHWQTSTDPDSQHEKLLDVTRLGPLGTFNVAAGSTDLTREAGSVMTIPIVLTRSSTFFERVRFKVTNLPAGWSAAFGPTSLLGWTANATSLRVGIPLGTAKGRYDLGVVASNEGRTDTVTVPIQIVNDIPTAKAPVASMQAGVKLGATAVGVRVAWPAATDPSSPIGAYEVQTSVAGGTWGATVGTAGTVHQITRSLLVGGTSYRFRVRAQDTAGNWSPWVESASPTRIYIVDDRRTAIAYSGTWTHRSYAYAVDGTLTGSSRAGSRATMTFTGREIAVVGLRSQYRGSIEVYLDGVLVRTVSLHATPWGSRQVIYARSWSSLGTHKISLRVRSGSTYPLVELDAFLVDK